MSATSPLTNEIKIGLLTSGGDAQGMNAAVRAVVRTALVRGVKPYAVLEGWQGAVDGGDKIHPLTWSDVSGILNAGGTIIGTARCNEFRERSGMRRAVKNLVENGIDRLIVIGGDGSLSGTDEFRSQWPSLLQELVDSGEVSPETAAAHGALMIVGLVGSIDNDMVGTDMTIGADSALHRIVDALDDISSTAASHQRTFVVEVMGRSCGYLPLMAAVAGGCDYVVIPEQPPGPGWEEDMCAKLKAGRDAGRRESIVLVAEGARDQAGQPITSQMVAQVLNQRLNADARVTILGHVQRGGTPSGYDRWMSTLLGYAAVQELLDTQASDPAVFMGIRRNRICSLPLVEKVAQTREVSTLIQAGDFPGALAARGTSFRQMVEINQILSSPPPVGSAKESISNPQTPCGKRVAIMHAGGLAPGMNTAARAAVRFGLHFGFQMLGVQGSFQGLIDGQVRPLAWDAAEGWGFTGGAELGTRRAIPTVEQFYALGRAIENHQIDALLVIGGYNAYLAVQAIAAEKERFPAFNIPMLLVPASIDNNLPGSELSIGADSALNNAVWALDRIKESAAASRRCFVAEAMGRHCGYLALMSGIAAGAEMVYLEEEDVTLARIAQDAALMRISFQAGRRLFLVLRNEEAGGKYNLEFMARVFEEEAQGTYDVRATKLGHLQQGGVPSPFDRLLATRFVYHAMGELTAQFAASKKQIQFMGLVSGEITSADIATMPTEVDPKKRRPVEQWWLDLRPVIRVVSEPSTEAQAAHLPILRTEGESQ